jgi:hypothetical protein
MSSGARCCRFWRPSERQPQEPNGKVKVELGGESEVLQPPDDKDVDGQMIVDLRRMLTNAGLQPS